MEIKSELVQGSDSWLEYRLKGIGASECASILGCSPYQSRTELYNEKLGLSTPKEKNAFILNLGHTFEVKARARLELELDIEFEPACVEHSEHPWIRASLDAVNFESNVFAEIKYVGAKKLEAARKGEIVPHHFCQIQAQFLCTGFEKAYYVLYTLNEQKNEMSDYHVLEVTPDKNYIEALLYPALKSFWDCVVNKIPPPEEVVLKKSRKRRVKNDSNKEVEASNS